MVKSRLLAMINRHQLVQLVAVMNLLIDKLKVYFDLRMIQFY